MCYVLFLRGTGGWGVSVMCAILGCAAQVCLLAAVLCGSLFTVCPYPMSTADSTPFVYTVYTQRDWLILELRYAMLSKAPQQQDIHKFFFDLLYPSLRLYIAHVGGLT